MDFLPSPLSGTALRILATTDRRSRLRADADEPRRKRHVRRIAEVLEIFIARPEGFEPPTLGLEVRGEDILVSFHSFLIRVFPLVKAGSGGVRASQRFSSFLKLLCQICVTPPGLPNERRAGLQRRPVLP